MSEPLTEQDILKVRMEAAKVELHAAKLLRDAAHLRFKDARAPWGPSPGGWKPNTVVTPMSGDAGPAITPGSESDAGRRCVVCGDFVLVRDTHLCRGRPA